MARDRNHRSDASTTADIAEGLRNSRALLQLVDQQLGQLRTDLTAVRSALGNFERGLIALAEGGSK